MQSKAQTTKTISITAGKGGVGKTTVTCNLAHSLAEKGRRVLIFDGDLGLANVDIFFGLKPRGHILEVVQGERSLADIITPVQTASTAGRGSIDLISSGSGLTEFNRMSPFERRALVEAVSAFEYQYDYLLIDTGPGLSDQVLYLNSAAQQIIVVINPDAASLADSYALIKVLHREFYERKFAVVCNQVKDENDGFSLFQRFAEVTHRFLFLSLDYWGSLPTDPVYRKAATSQRLALRHETGQNVRQSFEQLSLKVETNMRNTAIKGGLQFFWEQVVGVA